MNTRGRVCLVSTGHPATNPRAVKEADALTAAGYHVTFVGAFAGTWAAEVEADVMRRRSWTLRLVDWRRETRPGTFWWSRARQWAADRANEVARVPASVAAMALTRPAAELRRLAESIPADLFVAHNLGALPAAAAAARRHGARLAFDAEDFHSGQLSDDAPAGVRHATEAVEHEYIPACDYVTASSPGIAAAYAHLVRRGEPQCVLNVSPRADRPAEPVVRPADGTRRVYWFSQTIGPNRGLEDAVRAVALLGPHVQIHLRGTWADGYERTLRHLAETHGLTPGQIEAHPPVSPDRLVALSETFDLGLALEPGENRNSDLAISNKLFTYLMAGLPVVATQTAGQTWAMARMPGAGWSYRAGQHGELADILRNALASPLQLAAARVAARVAADSRFCWEIEQGRLLAVVNSVVGSSLPDADVARMLASAAGGAGR